MGGSRGWHAWPETTPPPAIAEVLGRSFRGLRAADVSSVCFQTRLGAASILFINPNLSLKEVLGIQVIRFDGMVDACNSGLGEASGSKLPRLCDFRRHSSE